MKPNWEDAPQWAKFLAMDQSGEWYWYSHYPSKDYEHWTVAEGEYQLAREINYDYWETTVEPRP